VSSIPIKELNIMEMEFLSALEYNIHIQHQTYLNWTEQCQLWWNRHNQPLITISKKRPLDNNIIEFTHKKRHLLEDRYSMYYTPPICKPILSWSSSCSTTNHQQLPHNNFN
jgi:malic enzyme